MSGYVYKITNKENGKWYIGSTNGKNKNYFSSGILINKALKKYGKESFEREILYEGEDFRNQEEKMLINCDAKNDARSYNLKNEALGGAFYGSENGMFGKKHTQSSKEKIRSKLVGKKRPEQSVKMAGNNNPMYGRSDQSFGIINRAKQNTGKKYEEIFGEDKAKVLRKKLSESQTGKKHNLKKVVCPHCLLEGKGPNMTRYHFEKCKKRVL